jgi:hypothetical protein
MVGVRLTGWRRKLVAVLVLGAIAGLAWATIEAGKPRDVVLVLLAGFALRVMLMRAASE